MKPTNYIVKWASDPILSYLDRRISTSGYKFFVAIYTSDKNNSLNCSSISWSYYGININKLVHSLNGNKKQGYHVAVWNCRRDLVDSAGNPTSKFDEINCILKNISCMHLAS